MTYKLSKQETELLYIKIHNVINEWVSEYHSVPANLARKIIVEAITPVLSPETFAQRCERLGITEEQGRELVDAWEKDESWSHE